MGKMHNESNLLSVDELKKVSLNILNVVSDYCKDNNIQYSLAYGTLLGSVRHKGFIPWDDDIDIMMLRPDYERFIHGFNGYNNDFYVLSPELNDNYYAPYANVCYGRTILIEGDVDCHRGIEMGVKIDLFPIDAVHPRWYFRLAQTLFYKMWCVYRYKKPFIDNKRIIENMVIWVLAKSIGYKKLMRNYIGFAKAFNVEGADYVDNVVFPVYKNKEICPSLYKNYVDVLFEGYFFKAIAQYDEYLRRIYGDYMKLPPEEKRVPHHSFKAYWKY